MGKKTKSVFLLVSALFLSYQAFAYDVPEMKAVDVSGTGLQPYFFSATEVTQQLYEAVTGKNPSACVQSTSAFSKMLAGEEQGKRPVDSVTFFDAMWFCNLLTEKELGKYQCVYTLEKPVYDSEGRIIRFGTVKADFSKTGYRLPTRAEWENAAGGYPASGAMYAWEFDNSGARGEGRSGFGTHAVAKKLPDISGLYDMAGNVSEMCHEAENLNLCIMGTSWNKTDEYYTDGYTVDYLYGYTEYTVSRNHARESFPGFSTCGFRLCRSVSDSAFTLTAISAPDISDTYSGIVPVTVKGSGFLARRTEPLIVTVEGFSSELAGSVEWRSDDTAIVPVKASAFSIEDTQQSTLRVKVSTSKAEADISGSVTRIHTEFPVHPGDVLLDDGTVVSYEENRVFSGYETEHAAAVVIDAPYDGARILALGLTGYDPASSREDLGIFLENYGERADIFGTYFGSGWYIPSADELKCLDDAVIRGKTEAVLSALCAFSVDDLLTSDGSSFSGLFVPVKDIKTNALITQKYEFMTMTSMLAEAAEQEKLAAARAAEEAAARKAAEEAAAAARKAAAEKAAQEAEKARLAALEAEKAQPVQTSQPVLEETAVPETVTAETTETAGEVIVVAGDSENPADETETEGEEKKGFSFLRRTRNEDSANSVNAPRRLVGFGVDVLKVTEPAKTIYAEFSTGLFVPFLYLAAEGTVAVSSSTWNAHLKYLGFSITSKGVSFSSWDAAVSLGLSVRMNLGIFKPDLFISGGVMTNELLLQESPYVQARLEAGIDVPLFKQLSLTARYSADLDDFELSTLLENYRLTAGVSITF